jgi:hypothetical protein
VGSTVGVAKGKVGVGVGSGGAVKMMMVGSNEAAAVSKDILRYYIYAIKTEHL